MRKSPVALAILSAFSLSFASLAMAQVGAQSTPPPTDSKVDSFLQLDRNMDGKLSHDEASGSVILKDQFTEADTNQDSSIDASEFSAFVAKSGTEPAAPSAGTGISFTALDSNNDGMLSQEEVRTHPTLSQQYSSVDQDKDNYISQAEFSAFESRQSGQATAAQPLPFEQIDSNKDGWISKQEYDLMMGGGQPGMISFQSLDVNRDGAISQNEANVSQDLAQKFTQYDKDRNGTLDQSEFSAIETWKQQQGTTGMPK